MSETKVILHWLNLSRSNRILWLLELLDVNYEVKVYKRTAAFRAPKELTKVHPLGKSPVIEVLEPGEEPHVIAESGNIIQYLIEKFDKEKKFTPSTERGKWLVNYYYHFSESSLQPVLTGLFINEKAKELSPFFAKPFVNLVVDKINAAYFGSESARNLGYLESVAKENDAGYFVENKLTGADVMLSFPITELVFSESQRAGEDPKETYPYLYKWSQKVLNDPAYQKTPEIIAAASAKL